jgi:hypothetical protein
MFSWWAIVSLVVLNTVFMFMVGVLFGRGEGE